MLVLDRPTQIQQRETEDDLTLDKIINESFDVLHASEVRQLVLSLGGKSIVSE